MDDIGPIVRHDLRHHVKTVTVDQWINFILDVPPEKIAHWSRCLNYKKLLHGSTSIMKYLQYYCDRASRDPCPRSSWSTIVNTIITLAPTLIPDLSASTFPLLFVQNDSEVMDIQREDGSVHSPDVLVVPESIIPDSHMSGGVHNDEAQIDGISWGDILACITVQYFRRDSLKEVFENCKLKATKTVGPSPCSSTAKRLNSDPQSSILFATGLERRHAEELASYALELLSSTSGTRTHCLQLLVDGDRLRLWYYDAGGIIRSEWMYWIDYLPKFAAIIVAFAQLGMSGWGVGGIPTLKPPSSPRPPTSPLPKSLSGYTLTMTHKRKDGVEEDVKVTLQDEVYSQYCLVGRRTIVYGVTTEPKISEKPLVLKMSMQESDQTPENEFIEHATNSGVDHLPEVHMWSTKESEWHLSSGVWGPLFPSDDGNREYRDQSQRLIVFTKYKPIEEIIHPRNMHHIMMRLIQCLHDLRYKANIVHRDISLGNLMYKQLDDGTIWLILNDFDLAVIVDDNGLPVAGNASKHRTGTLPFMAHELLQDMNMVPITHYLRHDYESVFFVALSCMVRPDADFVEPTKTDVNAGTGLTRKARKNLLKEWELGSLKTIFNTKRGIVEKKDDLRKYLPTPAMRHYGPWIAGFWQVLSTAYNAHSNTNIDIERFFDAPEPPVPQQNIETLGDSITLEKIQERLRVWEQRHAKGITTGFVPFFTA
ncbi:hypothetical protein NLI96_g3838 [Meripilus lineatus]|uniref:Fungal-type protein kinase domain-containing protein n=1 Tax=Meripilus lineatus TaxID=2056292 RepID=A0AAD5V694_9APHY|nr:hypothetical protein NLI96_g3838 [Physisporinus lineatus]